MRLARLGPAGAETPTVVVDGTHHDLRPVLADLGVSDLGPAFFAADGLARAAADLGVLGLQAQDRSGHRALATAGLPRQSDDLPRPDGQVDAADGGQRAIVRAVGDGESFEAEQVGHRRAFSRGLKISSSA